MYVLYFVVSPLSIPGRVVITHQRNTTFPPPTMDSSVLPIPAGIVVEHSGTVVLTATQKQELFTKTTDIMKRPPVELSTTDGAGSSDEVEQSSSHRPHHQLRLLLHTIDGTVPYLTPSLLESHFPPSSNKDLWIGLAVRDACVVPSYHNNGSETVTGAKEKTQTKANNKNKNGEEAAAAPKPRGYTFAANEPDPWLLNYTRVTVPSFDLVNDCIGKQQPQGPGNGNHMLVWTPHGRQTLTQELYSKASSGLLSHHTLSLYDQSKEGDNRKRQEKALVHTQQLFQEFLNQRTMKSLVEAPELSAVSPSSLLWAPILIPPQDAKPTNALSLEHIQDKMSDISGVGLIGRWRPELDDQLKSLLVAGRGGVPNVALLATDSLSELLEACRSQVINVIGTDLPTRWARDKKAFGLDYNNMVPSTTGAEGTTSKRQKRDSDDDTETLDSDGCMDLHDISFARDSRPLVPACQCMTCHNDKFSRAYIHHLVCAKEMVAEILLFGHNLHHLLKLIRWYSKGEDQVQK